MFFLQLPMKRTLEILNQVESSKIALPEPELYIIFNGKTTKNKVVWRTLVDVNRVKNAVDKLKQLNCLYKDVSDDAVDDSAKQVIEVDNGTSSTMFKKLMSDIAGLQAYIVRSLDNKLLTDSDIDQYKVTSVHEHPLNSWQLHVYM